MSLRAYRRAAAVAATLGTITLIAACGGANSTGSANGSIALQLTDAPFLVDSVKSVDVFVVRVDGRQADADSATAAKGAPDDSASAGGWTTLASPNQSVNLLAYQNGQVLPLGQKGMPPGSYRGFRLIIDASKSSLTLKNGMVLSGTSTPSVKFPSGARSGIKIVLTQAVTVTADQTTTVLIDFVVADSFVMRGNSIARNGLLFKPVVRASIKP